MNTAYEKFKKMQNPTSVWDYGLSLNQQELRTFPEGREILAEMKKGLRKRHTLANRIGRMSNAMLESFDRILVEVFNNETKS